MTDIPLKVFQELMKDKSFVDKMNKTRKRFGFCEIKPFKKSWLDTCLVGYEPCHTCKDLEACQNKFQKSCGGKNGNKRN